MPGRLAESSSPYLLQHADNPVNWYPWGEDAFRTAEWRDVPLFISIGYATCHWCHVMERESFEDEDIAKLMNESFVSVKVDREEHPDVDHFYMTACTAGGRRGGWPLTILALPDGRPFYAATYLPPRSRGGRAGLTEMLTRIAEMWRDERSPFLEAARDITGLVERLEEPPADLDDPTPDADTLNDIRRAVSKGLNSEFDAGAGGFGQAPKFPVFHRLRYLLGAGGEENIRMVRRTLRAMRAGGIWDHVGHGFHRYSTDRHWHLPHFEKMLYDQAMALMTYAEAWTVTGDELFLRTCHQLSEMIESDFGSVGGLFASAWDADSEGEEGRYYVWSADELRTALPDEADRRLVQDRFGVRAEGNFSDEATGRPTGLNVLDAGAPNAGADAVSTELADRFEPVRKRLASARKERTPPLRDDKCLSDWNGLFIAAAAVAGRLTDTQALVDASERTARNLLDRMRTSDGRMLHRAFRGDVGIEGGIDDYAFPALGCLELFQATGRPVWLEESVSLASSLVDRFHDDKRGTLRITTRDDIPVAQTRLQDEAYPSGTGVAVGVLVTLGGITGRDRLTRCAESVLSSGLTRMREWPTGHLTALSAARRVIDGSGEIVVIAPAGHSMHRIVSTSFVPDHVRIHVYPESADELGSRLPFVKSLVRGPDEPAVYICTDRTCDLPITGITELERSLDNRTGRSR